jgi:hypothetical protein
MNIVGSIYLDDFKLLALAPKQTGTRSGVGMSGR